LAIIYSPRGPASEYAELAANLYRGCSHGCLYCYAPGALFMNKEDFHNESLIAPRPNVIAQLKKDCIKYANSTVNVLLSFTTDAYQPCEKDLGITRQALELFVNYNIPVTILTKGGSWGLIRDLNLIKSNPKNEWAVTLTETDPEMSRIWEPLAALPNDRIESLKIAKSHGIKTWVSLEPVVNPQTVYEIIKATHKFVDLYKVGKYNAKYKDQKDYEKSIDWKLFRTKAIELLDRLNCKYIIKKDLLEA
jgi:DNA repair photolyase